MNNEKNFNRNDVNQDYIVRVTAQDGTIRAFGATTRHTVNQAARIHVTSPVVTAASGRLLTAAAIMGCTLKGDTDILTLSVRGDGPVKGIVATSDALSRVKCYPYVPQVDIPLKANGKLDVSGAIGKGSLSVIKDIGLKEPYVGNIPLVSGEIGEDLTYYFAKSEQIPTSVGLGVLVDRDYSVKQAGGFLIQLMPGAAEHTGAVLEERIGKMDSVTTLLDRGMKPEDILNMLLEGMSMNILGHASVEYYCNCNKARVEKALVSIGLHDLREILEEDGKADLHCHFCNKNYHFDGKELRNLILHLEKNNHFQETM